MERVLTSTQMKNADKYTIEQLGIPAEILMERAGTAVADEIKNKFKGGRTLILIGKGNNGGDGKIVARELMSKHGFSVSIFDFANPDFDVLEKKYDIIVDCIFGTGLNKKVDGIYSQVIEKVNQKRAYKIACDIPSGLNSDTGFAMGSCFMADFTIAIQEYKLGHFLNDGLDYSGKVITKDIGISIWEENTAYKLTDSDVKENFPKRKRNVNKGTFGKCAIIGGSKAYIGSCLMTAGGISALKMGAGYSHLAIPESFFEVYAGKNPELTLSTLKDDKNFIVFDKDGLDKLLNYSAIGVGMGMGDGENTYKTVEYLLKNYKGKLLIDADGINSIAKFGVDVLEDKKCQVILTPHLKEFSRLIGEDVEKIKVSGIELAKQFCKKYSVNLVLKSATSIITDGEEVCINVTGNSALAKAGSGDILSGLIVGLTARGVEVFTAGKVGSYILGRSAELAVKQQNEYTVTATDIIDNISRAINSL